jgi:DNA-binding response OmpR family regulator
VRLLVVEDEARIAAFLVKGLTAAGYSVDRAATAAEALELIARHEFALAVLDLRLPDGDGLEVLRAIRGRGDDLPVIVLTARSEIGDRVEGLELGADDYLTKPFAFDELLARVRARLRGRSTRESVLASGEIELNLRTRRARGFEGEVDLTAREFSLLETLLRHAGQVLSREQLLSQVWGMDFDPGSNLVDVYVGYLRRKLGEGSIETVRGAGYRLHDRRGSR